MKENMRTTFNDIVGEMQETYKKKNSDYGNSFNETIEEFGFVPAVARINDKVKRVKNIVKGQDMNYQESLRDNLMDIANYCVMTIMSIDDKKETEKLF
jgi:hypothetical protein